MNQWTQSSFCIVGVSLHRTTTTSTMFLVGVYNNIFFVSYIEVSTKNINQWALHISGFSLHRTTIVPISYFEVSRRKGWTNEPNPHFALVTLVSIGPQQHKRSMFPTTGEGKYNKILLVSYFVPQKDHLPWCSLDQVQQFTTWKMVILSTSIKIFQP